MRTKQKTREATHYFALEDADLSENGAMFSYLDGEGKLEHQE